MQRDQSDMAPFGMPFDFPQPVVKGVQEDVKGTGRAILREGAFAVTAPRATIPAAAPAAGGWKSGALGRLLLVDPQRLRRRRCRLLGFAKGCVLVLEQLPMCREG